MGIMSDQSRVYQKMPKVELHRHLEGSLRLGTMLDIARAHQISLPESTNRLSPLVQVQEDEPFTYQNFLAKFTTLRMFYRSQEVIQRITFEAIEDAARDQVGYMELRFTPVALSRAEGYPLGQVIDWVCESTHQAEEKLGIQVRLIVSVNRHESTELAEQVARLAADRINKGVVGMDMAGNEAEFSGKPFAGIFHEARQAGLRITVHAGEWGGASNVREAIEVLDAERIGHGVRIMEDPNMVALARERQTVFEVCVTSNYQTGVVTNLASHPLMKMLEAGLNVTLDTDDPSISQITLSNEYQQACEELGLPLSVLKERVLASGRAAFLPEKEKTALVERLKKELQ
jgi:adenosine deaminase